MYGKHFQQLCKCKYCKQKHTDIRNALTVKENLSSGVYIFLLHTRVLVVFGRISINGFLLGWSIVTLLLKPCLRKHFYVTNFT